MKLVVALAISLLLATFNVRAQGSQVKLYLQQIAANKVYIEYLQKGYRIAKNGLNTIGSIKNGHFSLDKDFFSGLESINPKVRNYVKIAEVIDMNIQLVKHCSKSMREARQSNLFNEDELSYITKVLGAVTEDCVTLLDALIDLLSASRLKMSDDERLKRIDGLYDSMQENYVFTGRFIRGIQIMNLQRYKETSDARTMSALHGIE